MAKVGEETKYILDLVWADHADNETGLIVERSEDGGDTWTVLGDATTTTAANINEYTDETADPGKRYYYRVKAVAGESKGSGAASLLPIFYF